MLKRQNHKCYNPPPNEYASQGKACRVPNKSNCCWICGKSTHRHGNLEKYRCVRTLKASESTTIHKACYDQLLQYVPSNEHFSVPKEGFDCQFFLKCNELAHKYMKDIIYPGALDKFGNFTPAKNTALIIESDDEDNNKYDSLERYNLDNVPYFQSPQQQLTLVKDQLSQCRKQMYELHQLYINKVHEEHTFFTSYQKLQDLICNDSMTRFSVQNNAATIIQKNFKMYILRKKFSNQLKATITIQKFIRGYQAKKAYKTKLASHRAKKKLEEKARKEGEEKKRKERLALENKKIKEREEREKARQERLKKKRDEEDAKKRAILDAKKKTEEKNKRRMDMLKKEQERKQQMMNNAKKKVDRKDEKDSRDNRDRIRKRRRESTDSRSTGSNEDLYERLQQSYRNENKMKTIPSFKSSGSLTGSNVSDHNSNKSSKSKSKNFQSLDNYTSPRNKVKNFKFNKSSVSRSPSGISTHSAAHSHSSSTNDSISSGGLNIPSLTPSNNSRVTMKKTFSNYSNVTIIEHNISSSRKPEPTLPITPPPWAKQDPPGGRRRPQGQPYQSNTVDYNYPGNYQPQPYIQNRHPTPDSQDHSYQVIQASLPPPRPNFNYQNNAPNYNRPPNSGQDNNVWSQLSSDSKKDKQEEMRNRGWQGV